eukprot:3664276-Amphidinium_carterae.1
MVALRDVRISWNRFTGMLPACLSSVMALTHFDILRNGFTGMLPDSGIRQMLGVTYFTMGNNDCTGTLPENLSALMA